MSPNGTSDTREVTSHDALSSTCQDLVTADVCCNRQLHALLLSHVVHAHSYVCLQLRIAGLMNPEAAALSHHMSALSTLKGLGASSENARHISWAEFKTPRAR